LDIVSLIQNMVWPDGCGMLVPRVGREHELVGKEEKLEGSQQTVLLCLRGSEADEEAEYRI